MVGQMVEEVKMHVQGHTEGNLTAEIAVYRCGDITDGVGLRFEKGRGGFVVSFKDFERAYKAALKFCAENPYLRVLTLNLNVQTSCGFGNTTRSPSPCV